MLVEAAVRTDGVVRDPMPRVFQTALSDFYVEYRLVCLALPTDPRPRAELLSTLHANVLDVFNEHGVQIMSPHYFTDPHEAKVVPPANGTSRRRTRLLRARTAPRGSDFCRGAPSSRDASVRRTSATCSRSV